MTKTDMSDCCAKTKEEVFNAVLEKWEYWMEQEEIGYHPDERMNELGKEGWECYAVTRTPHNITNFYFKRRSAVSQLAKEMGIQV